MSRIRTIKPDFFRSLDVAELTHFEQLLWIGIWTEADDHGRLIDDARLIKAALFPLDNSATLERVAKGLEALALRGRVARYAVDGRSYLAVVNWHEHQAINRPGKPKHPAPTVPVGDPSGLCPACSGTTRTAVTDTSRSTHGALTEDSVSAHGGLTSGREGKGREQGGDARARASTASHLPAPSGQEPPLRCLRHTDNPAPGPCPPCGDARRARDAWMKAQDDAARNRPTPLPDAPVCARHPDAGPGSGRHCPACEQEHVPAPNLRVLSGHTAAAAGA